MPKKVTLEELAARAARGDVAATNDLSTGLQPILKGYFIRRIGMKPEVDDLVQNSLMRVVRSLPDLKDPNRLKGFAMKAALFELQDYFRGRYSVRETLYDAHEPPDVLMENEESGLRMDIERALSELSPRAREIIELREYGYRYEEIAETIGSTEAAVKMQVKRAFEKLRSLLGAVFLFWMTRGMM